MTVEWSGIPQTLDDVAAPLPGQSFESLNCFQSWEQKHAGLEALEAALWGFSAQQAPPQARPNSVLVVRLLCHDEALDCLRRWPRKTCVSVRKSDFSLTKCKCREALREWVRRPAVPVSGREKGPPDSASGCSLTARGHARGNSYSCR